MTTLAKEKTEELQSRKEKDLETTDTAKVLADGKIAKDTQKDDLLQKELDSAGETPSDIKKEFFEASEKKAAEKEKEMKAAGTTSTGEEEEVFAKDINTQERLSNKISSMLSKIEARIDKSEETIGVSMKAFRDDKNVCVMCTVYPPYSVA